ncbi:MAG: hypothetical protein ACE5HR_00390 [bacterium]
MKVKGKEMDIEVYRLVCYCGESIPVQVQDLDICSDRKELSQCYINCACGRDYIVKMVLNSEEIIE